MKIKRSEVFDRLKSTNGKIFGVKFIKRTTGELREMTARMEVKSHLTGGGPAYDREAAKVLCVFDMAKAGYRSIPVEGVQSVKIEGVTYEVTDET